MHLLLYGELVILVCVYVFSIIFVKFNVSPELNSKGPNSAYLMKSKLFLIHLSLISRQSDKANDDVNNGIANYFSYYICILLHCFRKILVAFFYQI